MKNGLWKCIFLLLPFSATVSAQETLQVKAEAIIIRSCGTCHTTAHRLPLVNDKDQVIWTTVDARAERIVEVLEDRVMPPPRAPASARITDEERADLIAYVETLIEGAEPQPQPQPEPQPQPDPEPVVHLDRLTLPKGFSIEVFAVAKGARSMAVHESGIVFVGTGGLTTSGPTDRVYAIVPAQNGRASQVLPFMSGLESPNGVALHGNDLYVAESTRVIRFSNAIASVSALAAGGNQIPRYTVIKDNFADQENHFWKYLGIGPDQKLYVPIGADCNVCLPEDRTTTAGIFRMDLDGSDYEQVALGVRNTVGFDWHPVNQDLWFTDNGRDLLGDDSPSDELNHMSQETPTPDFGFPYCFGRAITDPDFGLGQNCAGSNFVKPVVELGAHVAALGMHFYRGDVFPKDFRQQIFVAEHGSWNRSRKSGYRVRVVQNVSRGIAKSEPALVDSPFISGWLDDATQVNWGRPVDVKTYIDGSLLVSDDYAGVVYRVSYQNTGLVND